MEEEEEELKSNRILQNHLYPGKCDSTHFMQISLTQIMTNNRKLILHRGWRLVSFFLWYSFIYLSTYLSIAVSQYWSQLFLRIYGFFLFWWLFYFHFLRTVSLFWVHSSLNIYCHCVVASVSLLLVRMTSCTIVIIVFWTGLDVPRSHWYV